MVEAFVSSQHNIALISFALLDKPPVLIHPRQKFFSYKQWLYSTGHRNGQREFLSSSAASSKDPSISVLHHAFRCNAITTHFYASLHCGM